MRRANITGSTQERGKELAFGKILSDVLHRGRRSRSDPRVTSLGKNNKKGP